MTEYVSPVLGERVSTTTGRAGQSELSWNGIDRTWLPEMVTRILAGHITPLEARLIYARHVEEMRKLQAAA